MGRTPAALEGYSSADGSPDNAPLPLPLLLQTKAVQAAMLLALPSRLALLILALFTKAPLLLSKPASRRVAALRHCGEGSPGQCTAASAAAARAASGEAVAAT